MSISLNNMNSEVARAHDRIDKLGGWNNTVPNYSNMTTLPLRADADYNYTVPADGYLLCQLMGYNGRYAKLVVNNVEIQSFASSSNSFYVSLNGLYPVKAGDTIKYRTAYYDGNYPVFIKFVPLIR